MILLPDAREFGIFNLITHAVATERFFDWEADVDGIFG